ncbi:MAG: hypothetical protein KDA58_10045 [Planctomycetaceae bacterium]|nr:hypothetical protein [Planctomycetaceae bacterium]
MLPPFAMRPASIQWEPVPLHGTSLAIWCWFKPPQAPQDVLIQLPPELWQMFPGGPTLRILLQATGIDPAQMQMWVANQTPVIMGPQTVGLLDQPLAWSASPLVVRMHMAGVPTEPSPMVAAPRAGLPTVAPNTDAMEHVYQHIEADWQVVQQIETKMDALRKQLNGMAGRLKSLDRDLTPEEVTASDSMDKREWQDIRRWIRDAAAGVSRAMREFDVGDVSAAGSRNRFVDLYQQQVVPRTAPNPHLLANEFEIYRKMVQTQFQKMQSATQTGARDGEQRAQTFLSRIGAKIRARRGKR